MEALRSLKACACKLTGAVLIAGALPAVATAQETGETIYELAPASPWNVDYADDSCAIMRAFGDEQYRVLMELRQFAPGRTYRFLAASSQLPFPNRDPELKLGASEENAIRRTRVIAQDDGLEGFSGVLSLGAAEPGATEAGMDALIAPADIREIESLTVEGRGAAPIVLQTGNLAAPVAALQTCMNDLLASWSVDPQTLMTTSRGVTPVDRNEWVRQVVEHFPQRALRQGRDATFSVSLLVGPDGKVARCSGTDALTNEDFEQVACAALTEYARFDPALDANGAPTFGFWSTTMVYRNEDSLVPIGRIRR